MVSAKKTPMQRRGDKSSTPFTIQRAPGALAEGRQVTLHQTACCCCCCSCCIQVPVGAICGAIAAPTLLRVGQVSVQHRYAWPVRVRILVMGLLVGLIQGVAVAPLWMEWNNHLPTYCGCCGAFFAVAMLAAARALGKDRPKLQLLEISPRYTRSVLLVLVLSVPAGSTFVSALFQLNRSTAPMQWIIVPVVVCSMLAAAVGHRAIRKDQAFHFHPEAAF